MFPLILLYSPVFSCIPLYPLHDKTFPLIFPECSCKFLYGTVFCWKGLKLSVCESVSQNTECRACFAAKKLHLKLEQHAKFQKT